MEEEQYCLKWNNHQSTLLTVLTGLMDSEKLADCVLAADGKMVKAHQVIISACSPYLERLLNESRQPGLMPILVFSDLMFEELVAMKEYMYKGEVNIRQDALDSFLKAACALQIKGLADGGGGGSEDSGGGGAKRKAAQEQGGGAPPGRRRRRESRDSDSTTTSDMHHDQQTAQPAPVKKQNVFTAKVEPFEAAPVVKMEPVMEPAQPQMPQPQIQPHPGQLTMKPEPQDHHPEPETHDLTGLDDDEDYDYEMPGTSQPDLSQDISNWQMDNSMHSAEDFAASQSMNTSQPQQSSQGEAVVGSTVQNVLADQKPILRTEPGEVRQNFPTQVDCIIKEKSFATNGTIKNQDPSSEYSGAVAIKIEPVEVKEEQLDGYESDDAYEADLGTDEIADFHDQNITIKTEPVEAKSNNLDFAVGNKTLKVVLERINIQEEPLDSQWEEFSNNEKSLIEETAEKPESSLDDNNDNQNELEDFNKDDNKKLLNEYEDLSKAYNYCKLCKKELLEARVGRVRLLLPKKFTNLRCHSCGKQFDTDSDKWQIHMRKYLRSEGCFPKNKRAPTLDEEYEYLSDRDMYLCNFCGHQTKREDNLASHLISKHGLLFFNCAFCRKRFKKKEKLKSHLLKKHNPIPILQCIYCSYKTLSQRLLDYHQIADHLDESP